jgi:putative ABC transport system ATP-binding protein
MTEPVIRLSRVCKAFRSDEVATNALVDVSLAVWPAEFLAITGPSGCGKSTLLGVMGLLDTADSGDVHVLGERVTSAAESRLARLRRGRTAFMFQSFHLIDELSILENIEIGLRYQRVAADERRRRALEMLDRVGLSHRAKHRPAQLSGGQQQRAALARALVTDAPVILADEPTGNLDTAMGEQVMEMLLGLPATGTAVVVVTHAPELAARAHRVVSMLDGRIVGDEATAAAARESTAGQA